MKKEIVESGHTLKEDIFSILVAVILFTVGTIIFKEAGLIAGGTAGLSLILSYKTDISFGTWFTITNAPFFILSFMRMGMKFTLMTIFSIVLLSLTVDFSPGIFEVSSNNIFISAILGGSIIGVGMIILFRHRSSMGGLNILGLYLQDLKIMSAGKFMLTFDAILMAIGLYLFDLKTIVASALLLFLVNTFLIINHKPGRYSPTSKK